MTTRDIKAHLGEVYGAEVSPDLISRVTEIVREEIIEWQTRPLDRVYVIAYIDVIIVKIRADGEQRHLLIEGPSAWAWPLTHQFSPSSGRLLTNLD